MKIRRSFPKVFSNFENVSEGAPAEITEETCVIFSKETP